MAFPQKKSDIQERGKIKQAQKGMKKCLSNPILTPVSDGFPTENWDGEWTAPKKIIEERSLPVRVRRSATPKEVDRAPPPSKTAQIFKTPENTHGLKLTEKSLTPMEKTPKKEKPSQVWRGEKIIGPPENIGNIAAKCLSDPIVTPVTDEFPSENTEGQWIAPNFLKATKQRPLVQITDHADKISHKRIISNPIVTPCTDEYPSEGDKSELQKFKSEEKLAKSEQANIQRSPVFSINDATHKDNREVTERWMKDQMDLIRSLSGSQSSIFSTKDDETSKKEKKVDLTVTATDRTESCNVSSPSTPFGSNEFAASREHILHRKEKAWAKRSKGHETQRVSAGKRDKKKNVFGTVTKFIKAVSKRARHKRSPSEN
ncbi:unnamed protein product [Cylicocyclus nassatus]|uniref:Uncharacterized protein n=1 Tax=Cylicocyclus nassatus TaxID=53992 RepID=A0AA36GCP9_CYLNA|nr:unnamed protein product [Cylicocyclus nassatus]